MRAAGILFMTPDRRVLLLKRSAFSDHPSQWDLPGGYAAGNETDEETARREAAEEIGEHPDGLLEPIAQTENDGVSYATLLQQVEEAFNPHLNPEHTAFEWRTLTKLPNTLHPGVREVLQTVAAPLAQDKQPDVLRRIMAPRQIALDRATVRRIDDNGNLHVELTNISKAAVNGYLGREIPDFEKLGLDPDETYQLFRDPVELEKAAPTFNNIQLLGKHVPVSPAAPQKQIVVGSTGTDAIFKAPYLMNSLVLWDAEAIQNLHKIKELSCAYRYRADMTPGIFEGTRYDGVMREISGNHVALVGDGRAGPDVVVGDSFSERQWALIEGALLEMTA